MSGDTKVVGEKFFLAYGREGRLFTAVLDIPIVLKLFKLRCL